MLGEEQMVVATLPSGPFFLERKQYNTLLTFVCSPLIPDFPKLVALVGPIKSGKSAVLSSVLPGLLAAHHAVTKGPTPVIFFFAFDLADPPARAASALLREASLVAAKLGFSIGEPVDPDDALDRLGLFMGRLALGIANSNGVLCLLLDEVQVRYHASPCSALRLQRTWTSPLALF